MKRIKKIIPLLLVFTMIFLARPMSTQAQSPQAAVNKTVNTFFTNARNLNNKKMEKCFIPEDVLIFDTSASVNNILRPYNKKMTWKIKSTKIYGNKAKVTVRVNYRSASKAFIATDWKWLDDSVKLPSEHPAEFMWLKKRLLKTFKNCIKENIPDVITSNIKISLQKRGGKWKISQATDRLLNVVYCDLLFKGKSMEKYANEEDEIIDKYSY